MYPVFVHRFARLNLCREAVLLLVDMGIEPITVYSRLPLVNADA